MMVSAAVQLLRRVVKLEGMSTVADALCVTPNALDLYLRGNVAVPRLIQIALATFVIEHVPSLARAGHQLREQTRATIIYESGLTVRHLSL